MDIFFVGGAPKSGTTWMQRAIDAHPRAVCSGEGHFHGRIVKPMLDMLRGYNETIASVNRIVYPDGPFHRPLARPEALAIVRQTVVALMARRATADTLALGDKTPVYASVVRDLDALFPEMLFVLMVRDPRDVAASRLHQLVRMEAARSAGTGETGDAGGAAAGVGVLDPGSDAYRAAVGAAAEDWATAQERCRGFAADCPGRLLAVRYEDFLDGPAAVLTRVFAFLRLPLAPGQAAAIAAATSFEALSGRRNGQEDRSSFFRKGVKGDWPNLLDPWAVEAILARCGRGMAEMGYAG